MTARWHAPALWGAMLLFWGVVLAVWSSSALQAAPLLLAGAAGLVIAALAARAAMDGGAAPRPRPRRLSG